MPYPAYRFSLATLFLIITLFAGLFAGYFFGHEHGYAAGQRAWGDDHMVLTAYSVNDLVTNTKDPEGGLRSLADLITANVDRSSWVSQGGKARFSIDAPNNHLLILQTHENHHAIHTLLIALHDPHLKFIPSNSASPEATTDH